MSTITFETLRFVEHWSSDPLKGQALKQRHELCDINTVTEVERICK